MNVLFLTHMLPWPPHGGGSIKRYRMLEYLAARHELTLVCPGSGGNEEERRELASRVPLHQVVVFPGHLPRTFGNLIRSYIRGLPLSVFRNFSSACNAYLKTRISGFDAVVMDSILVAPCVPREYPGTVILHAHNAEYRIWESLADLTPGFLRRHLIAHESRRIRRFEADTIRRADVVLAARDDLPLLRVLAQPRRSFLETMHLGDEELLTRAAPDFSATEELLLTTGSLGWEPNADGLIWFLKTCWPELVRRRPHLRFLICGDSAPAALREAATRCKGVTMTGFIADLDPCYRSARVFVAPLRFGGGMKVKLIEAMYRGLPVATTPVGAGSIDILDGIHAVVREDPRQLADEIDILLSDRERWTNCRDAARRLMASSYRWDQALVSLDLALEQAVCARSAQERNPHASE